METLVVYMVHLQPQQGVTDSPSRLLPECCPHAAIGASTRGRERGDPRRGGRDIAPSSRTSALFTSAIFKVYKHSLSQPGPHAALFAFQTTESAGLAQFPVRRASRAADVKLGKAKCQIEG